MQNNEPKREFDKEEYNSFSKFTKLIQHETKKFPVNIQILEIKTLERTSEGCTEGTHEMYSLYYDDNEKKYKISYNMIDSIKFKSMTEDELEEFYNNKIICEVLRPIIWDV